MEEFFRVELTVSTMAIRIYTRADFGIVDSGSLTLTCNVYSKFNKNDSNRNRITCQIIKIESTY